MKLVRYLYIFYMSLSKILYTTFVFEIDGRCTDALFCFLYLKFSHSIIRHSLSKFGISIHHKGTHVSNRFVDSFPTHDEHC